MHTRSARREAIFAEVVATLRSLPWRVHVKVCRIAVKSGDLPPFRAVWILSRRLKPRRCDVHDRRGEDCGKVGGTSTEPQSLPGADRYGLRKGSRQAHGKLHTNVPFLSGKMGRQNDILKRGHLEKSLASAGITGPDGAKAPPHVVGCNGTWTLD